MAAASRAGVLAGRDLDGHARDVVGERTTPGPCRCRVGLLVRFVLWQAQPGHDGGRRHLARLERQLELFGTLARGAEPVRPVPGQLVAQLLDQHRLGLHLGDQETRQRLQVARVLRQGHGLVEHAGS